MCDANEAWPDVVLSSVDSPKEGSGFEGLYAWSLRVFALTVPSHTLLADW